MFNSTILDLAIGLVFIFLAVSLAASAITETIASMVKFRSKTLKKVDKVSISIASATREDLANKITDVFAVFGGDRREHPHPTHACPGYAMGMGVLLGIIAGVMDPGPGGAHPSLS
jgi:hypothetical protein